MECILLVKRAVPGALAAFETLDVPFTAPSDSFRFLVSGSSGTDDSVEGGYIAESVCDVAFDMCKGEVGNDIEFINSWSSLTWCDGHKR